MDPVAALVAMLAPPRCGACDDPCAAQSALCEACESALQAAGGGRAPVAGVGEVVWAAPYSAVARDLVTELKFGFRLRLADVAAGALAAALGADLVRRPIVPVPAAPARRRARGFDPAEEIARALAARTGTEIRLCLARADGPRQVGRRRAERIASPPRVRVTAEPPRRPLLVDDVLTTGSTLRACAAALIGAGSETVGAAVFARALGAGARCA